tara:strand:- start:2265 stop:2492 length:228 start_codon:yes stop_codon:yes gene_type:complete
MESSNTNDADEYLLQFQLPATNQIKMNKYRQDHFLSGTYVANPYKNSILLYYEKHGDHSTVAKITQNDLVNKYKT